jgi:hypothetical protein
MSHDALQLLTSITMAVATVVVAGATIYYAVQTRRLLREQQKTNDNFQRPNVQVTLGPSRRHGQLFEIVLKNTGRVPVHDVKAEVSPKDLPAWGNKILGELRIFNITIPVLLENEEYRDNAFSYLSLVNAKRQDSVVTMQVSYTDPQERRLTNTFRYDLSIYEGLPCSEEKDLSDVTKELEGLRTDLRKQGEAITGVLQRLEWSLGPVSRAGNSDDVLESLLRAFIRAWRDRGADGTNLVDPSLLKIRLLSEDLYYSLCAAQPQTKAHDDLRNKLLCMFGMQFMLGPVAADEFTALGSEASGLAKELLQEDKATPSNHETARSHDLPESPSPA